MLSIVNLFFIFYCQLRVNEIMILLFIIKDDHNKIIIQDLIMV